MNARKLNQRIEILNLKETTSNYSWESVATIWAKSEFLDKVNIFSKIGIGAKSVKFTIRKRDINLHQAIKWKNKHYFLTDIKEINRMYYEITTAQIETRECILTRETYEKNTLNRPVPGPKIEISFPGYLIEKYLGYQQQEPQAVNKLTYVLVTPKIIALQTGDLIKISEDTYNVQVVHNLDEFKNEYEITVLKEA